MSKRKVYVVGVGMTKFEKPGKKDYPEMGEEAVKVNNIIEDKEDRKELIDRKFLVSS
jgi:hypothetical protein